MSFRGSCSLLSEHRRSHPGLQLVLLAFPVMWQKFVLDDFLDLVTGIIGLHSMGGRYVYIYICMIMYARYLVYQIVLYLFVYLEPKMIMFFYHPNTSWEGIWTPKLLRRYDWMFRVNSTVLRFFLTLFHRTPSFSKDKTDAMRSSGDPPHLWLFLQGLA